MIILRGKSGDNQFDKWFISAFEILITSNLQVSESVQSNTALPYGRQLLVYYKHKRNKESETAIDNAVIQVFRDSRNNYGTRKIKKALEKQNINLEVDRHSLISGRIRSVKSLR